MNNFIKSDILKYILLLSNFKTELQASAFKDDGIINKEEQKVIDKIIIKTNKYIKDLEKIVNL